MSLQKRRGPKRGGIAPEHKRAKKDAPLPAGKERLRKARAHIKGHEMKLVKREWHRVVTRGGCVMCREKPPTADELETFHVEINKPEGHHCLPKRYLADDVKWNEAEVGMEVGANGVCLCAFHHAKHENHVAGYRLPRWLLPESVHIFAAKLNLLWLLDQEYPDDA